jgi:hypothetical protein
MVQQAGSQLEEEPKVLRVCKEQQELRGLPEPRVLRE